MVENNFVKVLLSPFSLIYGILISARNFLFQVGIIRRSTFNIPVINVGNLSIGGAGKTPHVEFLIRLLKPYLDISVLSRGYGRKSKGFLFVEYKGNALQFGDEPLQFKRKNKELVVAVSESRALGIPEILKRNPTISAVLLDDAFQHLAVKASLNILLTEESRLFTDDYLLPSGRLREWRSAYERADIIIVTKCRSNFNEEDKEEILSKINAKSHQKVFFSKYIYGKPYHIYNPTNRLTLDDSSKVVLVSAIANTDYLTSYLDGLGCQIDHVQYEDHHYFSEHEVSQIKQVLDKTEDPDTVLLCSEKDAMRLDLHQKFLISEQVPIFALPIKVEFLFNEGPEFELLVKNHLLDFKV